MRGGSNGEDCNNYNLVAIDMNSLISLLATLVLISTVSTLIFATFAYVASRRPERKKKAKKDALAANAAGAHPGVSPRQTVSMDGSGRTVPVVMLPGVGREEQVQQEWHAQLSPRHRGEEQPLFKTFVVEEDVGSRSVG